MVDCDVEDNKRVMEFFGITEENCPDMRVINMEKNMAKFAPEKSDLSGTFIARNGSNFLINIITKNNQLDLLVIFCNYVLFEKSI